jgi:hypothetical protein
MPESRDAFIVSRIGKDGSPERKSANEWLQNIVEPVCKTRGLKPIRSDQIYAPGRINEQVNRWILDSAIVIADLTDLNPNVMYEVGLRHGLELPIVLMATDGTSLPFDFHEIRTHWYDPSFHIKRVEEAQKVLSEAISEALSGAAPSSVIRPESAYGGINIEGSWKVIFPQETPHRRDITLELRQRGERIWGSSIHVVKSEETPGDPIRTYVQVGRIYNRFVQLDGKSPTPQRLLINSFLLEIVKDGREMCGGVLAYSTVKGGVFSLNCTCVRVS